MKFFRCLLSVAACFAGSGMLRAEEAQIVSGTSGVTRFSFPTEAGRVYEIQGTIDGAKWSRLTGPIFGDGAPATGLLSSSTGCVQFKTAAVDPATIGPAPATFQNQSLALHDGASSGSVFFNAAGGNVLRRANMAAMGFNWTWRRTAPDEGVAILSLRNGATATLKLKWLSREGGSYEITYSTRERDAGVFTLHEGVLRSDASPGVLPESLENHSVILREGSRVMRLGLAPGGQLNLTDDRGASAGGTWTFNKRSKQRGDLEINIPGLPAASYDLNLTADRAGVFNRGTSAPGGSGGPFSVGGPEPEADPDCPPPSLVGRSVRFADSKVLLLIFNADGKGTAVCEVEGVLEIAPFNYSYNTRSDGQAGLVVTYPGAAYNMVEEYDLDFGGDCNGDYTKRPSIGDIAGATSRGTFDQGGVAGAPPPGP